MKNVFNRSEVHSEKSDFLQNPYLSKKDSVCYKSTKLLIFKAGCQHFARQLKSYSFHPWIVSVETIWGNMVCRNVYHGLNDSFLELCCWHVIRKDIWYVTKLWIFEILCNVYWFSSSCLCPVWTVSVLYFEKKIRNRLRECSKIRNLVTYQITFLMT